MAHVYTSLVLNDVTKDICEKHGVSFKAFSSWAAYSEDAQKLHKIIHKSIDALR